MTSTSSDNSSTGIIVEKKKAENFGEFEPKIFGNVALKDKAPVKLILIHPDCPLNLGGACQLQCLVGRIQLFAHFLNGCDFKPENLINFCFSKSFPPIILSVIPSESNPLVGQEKILKTRLASLGIEYEILKPFIKKGYSAAIVVKEASVNIRRLENVSGRELFKPSKNFVSKEIFHCLYMTTKSTNLYTGHHFDTFRSFYRDILTKWKSNKSTVTLAIGNKNTGKSTTTKVLLNSWTSKVSDTDCIYLMDCDVGQSEFTPPGLISLHKITNPIFSVPFGSQLKTFPRSYYFGSITPESNVELYKSMIFKVFQDYLLLSAKDEHSLLVVNTVGWVHDIGAEIMDHLMTVVRPDLVLAMDNPSKNNFNADYSMDKLIASNNNSDKMKSSTIRDLTITGYLTQCFTKSLGTQVTSFSEVSTRMISFDYITIYIHPAYPITDRCYLAALNMSTIALCSIIPEYSRMYESERLLGNEDLPKKLMIRSDINEDSQQQPCLKCHGYGLVRAISIEKRKIYIITPTDPDELKNVTVFAIGEEIITPKWIYETQNAINAPYLMQTAGNKCAFDKLSVPMQLSSTPKKAYINRKRGFE